MKKKLALVLAGIMTVSLFGCGVNAAPEATQDAPQEEKTETAAEPAATDTGTT